MTDPNHDIVPTLRMFDGVMTGLAADEIERLRKRVAELEAGASAETRDLPMMRNAFRVTEVSGDPDPAKQSFAMRFSFPSIEALHAADDEWNKFIAAAQADAREPKIDAQPEGGEIAESLVPQGEVARSGGARAGLTDAQMLMQVDDELRAYLTKRDRERAVSAMRRALAARAAASHQGQPEPRAEVTDEQIAAMFERVTGYSIENGRAALNDADILGFARELLDAARAGGV
ncbi:hypothetical protein KTE54_20510 [Burkholderia multivorans]|uniref:hypothetical protein n=1 Tax=Burkholderia multivorans TaxID=87883 RepID=UPI001C27DCA3|nr:hypothetical protein [Burkholderia multivorans]MBU9563066.1 hypothetical protein [Burkholderia multivorans]